VVGLNKFQTFKDLFETYPAEQYGGKSSNEWTLMYRHYSTAEEKKYGALAIHLECMSR